MTQICVVKLATIGSDNGLSPGRRQAIIWTNAAILLIGTLRTNFIEILIGSSNIFIEENAHEDVVCEMHPFCLGLNVLTLIQDGQIIYVYLYLLGLLQVKFYIVHTSS